MSPDRVVYSFVLGWIALIGLLILLDWLGNPNRGGFRPRGDRPPSDRETRRAERARRRQEEDASVRAALRDAYGASSLRFTWTSEQEADVRRVDDSLVVEHRPDAVDVDSREVIPIRSLVVGDPLPNVAETSHENEEHEEHEEHEEQQEPEEHGELEEHEEPEQHEESTPEEPSEPALRPRGWTVGGDPLSLTAKGDEPAPATIRARVWKNLGTGDGWSDENRKLLAAGKAPARHNPLTGKKERAVVDVETGRAGWGDDPVDPFEPT